MKRHLLLMLLALAPIVAFAQEGGVSGRVVSRDGRQPIAGVTVSTDPRSNTTKTDSNGEFTLKGMANQIYMLEFEASGYEILTMRTVVSNDEVRDLYTLILTPALEVYNVDESFFETIDDGTVAGAGAMPGKLSSSKDLFTASTSYRFSEMRFAARGYDSQYSDVYLNGVRINDALSGWASWSLWSGLNEATRSQESVSGMEGMSYGVGGIGGMTQINARATQVRPGWSTSLVSADAMYRFRAMITYASGMMDNGWAYAFSLSTRQGYSAQIDGVYYNTYGYFGSVEKQLSSRELLSFSILGAPTQRGVQSASTQEAYDLVDDNQYNPNVGYQNGELRNVRVKEYHEPVATLGYNFEIDSRTTFNVSSSFRFGQNGYSALTWYAGSDPRPDYYRYLPSYYACSNPALLADQWNYNVDNISNINIDKLFAVNENGEVDATYGDGNRSVYMIEERHADQRDFSFAANFSKVFSNNDRFDGGVNFRRNRTENYSTVKDLLGGDYWVDVDKFAERDFGSSELAYQNNVDYYEEYGHAQAVTVGDKYSYDYYSNVMSGSVWGTYALSFSQMPNLSVSVSGELGASSMWRDGIWKKGLFLDSSQGKSETVDFLTYKAKANARYVISSAHTIEANVAMMQEAPSFQNSFVSPRTRNDITPGVSPEKIMSADLRYNFRMNDIRFSLAGYYTTIKDQTDVISFYNDLQSSFDNFAMSGIDKKYMGLEAAIDVPIVAGISVHSALSLGDYTYTSNPYYIEIADNSATALNEGTVYWDGFKVESTPQTAYNIGLGYRSNNYLFVSVDMNFYDNMYLSMNPFYRTEEAMTTMVAGLTYDEVLALNNTLRAQENFGKSYTLSASIGKSWYIQRKVNVGVSFEIKNLLNDTDIKTGGYEQMRVNSTSYTEDDGSYRYDSDGETITVNKRFDSKYFYMLGRNYYLNVYVRF